MLNKDLFGKRQRMLVVCLENLLAKVRLMYLCTLMMHSLCKVIFKECLPFRDEDCSSCTAQEDPTIDHPSTNKNIHFKVVHFVSSLSSPRKLWLHHQLRYILMIISTAIK